MLQIAAPSSLAQYPIANEWNDSEEVKGVVTRVGETMLLIENNQDSVSLTQLPFSPRASNFALPKSTKTLCIRRASANG